MSLRTSDYFYALPPDLIAQAPLPERRQSRLLVLEPRTDSIEHRGFPGLVELLMPGDVLVLNDTRVIRARLFATKDSGGRVELLVERVEADRVALCHVRASKTLKAGRTLALDGAGGEVLVHGREHDLYRLEFPRRVLDVLESHGTVPLPPYIERCPDAADGARYQTVYAREPGAVAAPTAGLHFDEALLDASTRRGVAIARVTLHVGAGTFAPIRADDLSRHTLHRERVNVPADTVAAIDAARVRGGRVVAVGTTVVRALEAAAAPGNLSPYDGDTDLFIRPGFRFRVVDALVTNFHLPQSSLLVLVSTFAGRERVLEAYAAAVRHRYRFFSYGDAMFIASREPERAL